jgi:cytidylate kinase
MEALEETYVITISHQIGSGGAAIGQKLSERLGVPFLDREILRRVSQKLHVAEEELEGREEQLSSFWQSFGRIVELMDPAQNLMPAHYIPTDKELFDTEAETIRRIAQNRRAILIGRCCRYILRDHSHHFSLLVHANQEARVQRVCSLYHVSPQDAERMIEANDRERTAYIRALTKQDWLDARLYDLCLNTSSTGLDEALDIVHAAAITKLGL